MNKAHDIIEHDTFAIIDYISANIGAALDLVSADRNDNKVSLESPKSYFYYPVLKGLETPSIQVYSDQGVDFRKNELQTNHINALVRMQVALLVEDEKEALAVLKAWRYTDALHMILDETTIDTVTKKIRLRSIVTDYRFSDVYPATEDGATGIYRKESMLFLNVYHFEES